MTAQLTGAVPPVEASVAPAYGLFTRPAGRAVVVTTRAGPLTVIDSFALAVCAVGVVESVAVTVNVVVAGHGRRPGDRPRTAEVQAGGEFPGGDRPGDRAPSRRSRRASRPDRRR